MNGPLRMPVFTPPTSHVRLSFIAAMEEFRAEGRGAAADDTMLGREIREFGVDWHDPARFATYTRYLAEQADEAAQRRPGHVPATTLWWVDGDDYLGRLAIRHRLTPRLLDLGGHVGYDVKPSARRQGHATTMLAAALPVAHALGIDPALVTCDQSNAGSRRVIEANGGVLEDQRGSELRFWVATR
ncbi:MAG: GNAT family N-acetyltransferase [Streptosporangiaceae bacterium]